MRAAPVRSASVSDLIPGIAHRHLLSDAVVRCGVRAIGCQPLMVAASRFADFLLTSGVRRQMSKRD